MDVKLICNKHEATYNKCQYMNTMGLSDSLDESLDIIALYPPQKNKGLNQWDLVPPRMTLLRLFTRRQ